MNLHMMTGFPKRLALILLAVLSLSAIAISAMPAAAQEVAPEQLALARKYIDITDQSSLYETTLVQTAVNTMKAIVSQNPELDAPTNAAITKTLDYYKGRKGDLMDQFARIYAQTFTMEELQAIVTFYESPAGLKLAKANAEINKSMKLVLKVYEGNLNKEFYAKVRAELKAGGFDI